MRPIVWAAFLSLALLVTGCGGSGTDVGGTGRAPTQDTKNRVQRGLGLNIRSMAMGGGGNMTGPASGSGAGMGDMMRQGFGGSGVSGGGAGGWGGGTEPGGGGDDDPPWNRDFYFDEWFELWVKFSESETGFRMDLFEDEAMTVPAGFMVTTYPASPDGYPQTYESSYEILAGPQGGSSGLYTTTIQSDFQGRSAYRNTYADGTGDEGESEWTQSRFTWRSRATGPDGFWYEDSARFDSDGSGASNWSDSNGYSGRFTYRADGSGHGRIEGPDPGLPATIHWNAEGRVTIRWADGTVEVYDWGWCEDGVASTDGEATPPGRRASQPLQKN